MNPKNIECRNCGAANAGSRFFCEKCGHFLRTDKVSDPEIFDSSQMKIMRILENLKYCPHSKIIWDDTVDLYARTVERLDALTSLPEIDGRRTNSAVVGNMERFLSMCRDPEFQIAFVGTIKTGKSTLINALLGKNYASVDLTPETAALTKFRYSAKDYIKVFFYSPEEWRKLWASCSSSADVFLRKYRELKADSVKDQWVGHDVLMLEPGNDGIRGELAKWSSANSAEHFFVKEVEVGISTLPEEFPPQVVFVDTPGLSDPVAYRSEMARDYIRKANAVFVCVDAQKMQKEEIEVISSVFSFSAHNKRKVHIIVTQRDRLNYPVEDWEKQKRYLGSHLVGKGFFDRAADARTNIMPSAAFIYNLCRDYDLLAQEDKIPLLVLAIKLHLGTDDETIRKNLSGFKRFANVDGIMERIKEVFVANYRVLLNEDIGNLYRQIRFDLKRIGSEKKAHEQEMISAADSSVDSVNASLKRKEAEKGEIEKAQARLTDVLQAVEKETQDRMTAIFAALDRCLEEGQSQQGKKKGKKE